MKISRGRPATRTPLATSRLRSSDQNTEKCRFGGRLTGRRRQKIAPQRHHPAKNFAASGGFNGLAPRARLLTAKPKSTARSTFNR